MPASIRMPGTGGMTATMGSIIEIVDSGPMPGSTPMRLPTSTPNTHHIRLSGCSATPKPYISCIRLSCIAPSPLEQGQQQVQAVVEDHHPECRQQRCQERRVAQAVLAVAERRDEHRHE